MSIEGRISAQPQASKPLEGQEPSIELPARMQAVAERARRMGESLRALDESASPEKKKRVGEKVGEILTLLSSFSYRFAGAMTALQGFGIASGAGIAFSISSAATGGLLFVAGTLLIALGAAMNETGEKKWREYRERAART